MVRRVVVIVAIAATLMAIHVQSIYTLWVLCNDLVYCVLFPQLLLVLFDPRATRPGSYAGMLVSFVLRVSSGEPMLGLPRLLSVPLDEAGTPTLPVKTIAMLSGLTVMWTVSRLTAARCCPVPLEPHGA